MYPLQNPFHLLHPGYLPSSIHPFLVYLHRHLSLPLQSRSPLATFFTLNFDSLSKHQLTLAITNAIVEPLLSVLEPSVTYTCRLFNR